MIDTVPSRGDENARLFRVADLVLVPVRPSPSDLWAVKATVDLLKKEGTPFLFVVNQATLNANITAQAIASFRIMALSRKRSSARASTTPPP